MLLEKGRYVAGELETSSGLLLFPVLAFLLGVKHAYDADHLIAVSNFLTRSKSLRDTSRMTTSWAIGHMLTAAIVTAVLFSVAQMEPVKNLLGKLEIGVAILLIVVGAAGLIWELPIIHEHHHRHMKGVNHSHVHRHRFGGFGRFASETHLHHPLFGVGIIHGLASNDEILILFVAGMGVGSLELLLGGVAIFTLGVVLGMLLFGIALTYTMEKYVASRVRLVVIIAAGSLSITYGFSILAGIGGFNPFDFLLS